MICLGNELPVKKEALPLSDCVEYINTSSQTTNYWHPACIPLLEKRLHGNGKNLRRRNSITILMPSFLINSFDNLILQRNLSFSQMRQQLEQEPFCVRTITVNSSLSVLLV